MRFLWLGTLLCLSFMVSAGPPPRIKFIENKNQWPSDIYFSGNIGGGAMQLKKGGFSYIFLDHQRIEEIHHLSHHAEMFPEENTDRTVDGVWIEVVFVGANRNAVPVGISKSTEYYNYFLGNDQTKWASGAYAYEGLLYPSFYTGIDLKVYGLDQNVKYDLIVAPGADPSVIKVSYKGMDKLTLENEELYIKTKLGDIIEKKPFAYQIIDGIKRSVPCEYMLIDNQMSFSFPAGYDPCYELVIDPLLIFSTYSGSGADSWGSTATPGENGKMYSSGIVNQYVRYYQANGSFNDVFSGTFPVTPGSFQTNYGGIWDVGILKYDSLGQNLLYASYLGGGDSEFSHSLIMNSQRELIVLGTTSSKNFPTSAGAFQKQLADVNPQPVNHVIDYTNGSDLFIARISEDGKQLLACSYLGGAKIDGLNPGSSLLKRNYGDDLRGDVITDEAGNIYVSSVTASIDLPAMNSYNGGLTDGIIVKLPPSLNSISWLRYIGGSGTDAAHTIKLDQQNNIYAAGGTASSNFPMAGTPFQNAHAGGIDGWIAKVSNNGSSILSSTFTGSSSYDQVYFVDLNIDGEVYVYGQTDGNRPISSPDIYGNPNSGQFVQKFTADLSQQLFYTVFGSGKGSPDISPTAFQVTDCNYLYMAGWGGSLNEATTNGFPTTTSMLEVTDDAWQKTTAGHDFYFFVLSEDAKERLYATFLGGPNSLTHVDGGTSRFDKSGVVYHAVCAGCGNSLDDFPTTPGVVSRTNNSLNCNNAAFKFDLSSLRAQLSLRGADKVCLPGEITIDNLSVGGEVFTWDFGDNTAPFVTTERTPVTHEFKNPGTYTVWLKTFDQGTCKVRDSTSIKVDVFYSVSSFPSDGTICSGSSYKLQAGGGTLYSWKSKDGSFEYTAADGAVTVAPLDSTLYYITVTEPSGCLMKDSVWVNVIDLINPDFEFERNADCTDAVPFLKVKNLTDSLWVGDHLEFDFGDGTISDLEEHTHQYERAGLYNVKLIARREFCVTEKVVPMFYGALKFPNVISPGVADNKNDKFIIQLGSDPGRSALDQGFETKLSIYDRWGKRVFESDNYQHDWTGHDVSGGVYYYEASVQDHATCKGWIHVLK